MAHGPQTGFQGESQTEILCAAVFVLHLALASHHSYEPQVHQRSLLFRSYIASLVLALAACSGPAPTKPPRGKPRPQLPVPDLTARSGPQIWAQLRQFHDMPGVCRRAVNGMSGVSVTALADTAPSPGCGYRNAVRLEQSMIPISRTVDISCPMAAAVQLWMRDVVQPAARLHLGATVTRVETFGTYACRTRNSQSGARLSEHATANAIDISGFTLADGRRVMVEQGWRGAAADAAFLRAVHKQSCGLFSVVIGPDGDAYHYNHLHLDMGRWRLCK